MVYYIYIYVGIYLKNMQPSYANWLHTRLSFRSDIKRNTFHQGE